MVADPESRPGSHAGVINVAVCDDEKYMAEYNAVQVL